ncbi:hypothetical protein BH11PSE12_BH11PSE12_04710 [soil metagenome]
MTTDISTQTHSLLMSSVQFVQNAMISGMAAYQATCDDAAQDYQGLPGHAGARTLALEYAIYQSAQRVTLEIESGLVTHRLAAEAAAVGPPGNTKH